MKLPNLFSDSCCALKPIKLASTAKGKKKLHIALAGNSNVGKSALFNYLTGLSQHVANWPGKTVEMAEGTCCFGNYEITVVDLPGIYSLSTFSKEEEVTREYIVKEKPDVVVNVIDSTALERNLFFTLQLLELGVPIVLCLNQNNAAKRKGIEIDEQRLGHFLKIKAVKTTATTGVGVWKLMQACCETAIDNKAPKKIRYLHTTEAKGEKLAAFVAEQRYDAANRIALNVQSISKHPEAIAEKIDVLTMHPIFGYLIMFLVLGIIFYSIFTFGNIVSSWISEFFTGFRPPMNNVILDLLWEGFMGGFVAGLTLVIPYVLPFYLLLTILEDTGYITRVAYLLDGIASRIGFHGKAIIPMILGYGCNVPACVGCRIMEYDRDRLIAAFAITMIPCTARTVVILALVGAYLGPWWALGLYIFNVAMIMILAKVAFKVLPGEPVRLIMEMPPYRFPSISSVLKHVWWKIKSIFSIVFPYYMFGGLLFALAYTAGIFEFINGIFTPISVGWLGLPVFATTLLLFGIVRKEFIVVLPAVIFGTSNLSTIFSPLQMVVITLIAMFYIPCLATIETLRREFGWKKALWITLFEIIFAVVLGGIAFRVLAAAGLS